MFAYLQGTKVDWLVMETSRQRKGFAQIPPAGNVDSHNIFCSWSAEAHVSIHSCDFTNGYSQGQEINRILLYRVPNEGATRGAILISRLSIYGTMGVRSEVMNSVLQKFLVGKEEHKAKDITERVQPINHDAGYGSTREATASEVHQR